MHPFATLDVPSGSVAIHWFGQNSYALKDPIGTIVQIDPYFPRERPSERYIHAQPPLDEATLPTDFVLLTHDHSDHTCVASLQRIAAAFPTTKMVGSVESVARLARAGLSEASLIPVDAGASLNLDALQVHARWSKPPDGVPAEGIRPPDVTHLGYVIEVGTMRIYVSGDLINTFADHDALVDPVAALKPEVGLLTMHPTEGEFPYFEGAVKLALRLGLRAAVPAHYACFTKRTYDPYAWAALLPADGPVPLIIPYNTAVVYAR